MFANIKKKEKQKKKMLTEWWNLHVLIRIVSIIYIRFKLLQEEVIEFNKLGLRNNVAQICVLEVDQSSLFSLLLVQACIEH